MEIKALTVCVDYDDLLSITLPRNIKHVSKMLVITSPEDIKTQKLVKSIPNAELMITDAFTRNGAKFNKGLAIEESFDVIGRDGWILIWDADTLFPENMVLSNLSVGNLYTPKRRILEDPREWTPDFNWSHAKIHGDIEFCGYFQLFNASDPAVRSLPWYETGWTHAGGADGIFQKRWSGRRKIRPPFEVLHLGPYDTNWFGRNSVRVDNIPIPNADEKKKTMEEFLSYKGWGGRKKAGGQFKEKIDG